MIPGDQNRGYFVIRICRACPRPLTKIPASAGADIAATTMIAARTLNMFGPPFFVAYALE